MAKITKIYEKVETKSCKHVTDVEMEIAKSDDNKYLILSTFGSSSRKEKGKASQIIHLDKETASDLVSILENRSYIGYKNENKLVVNANSTNTYSYYIVGEDGKGKFRERVSDEELAEALFYARVLD